MFPVGPKEKGKRKKEKGRATVRSPESIHLRQGYGGQAVQSPQSKGTRRISVRGGGDTTPQAATIPSPHPDPLPSHLMGAEREQLRDDAGYLGIVRRSPFPGFNGGRSRQDFGDRILEDFAPKAFGVADLRENSFFRSALFTPNSQFLQ